MMTDKFLDSDFVQVQCRLASLTHRTMAAKYYCPFVLTSLCLNCDLAALLYVVSSWFCVLHSAFSNV